MKMLSHKIEIVWVSKLPYGGEPSNQEQSHWAVNILTMSEKFVKSLRFLDSTDIAVSIALKHTDIDLGLSQRRR